MGRWVAFYTLGVHLYLYLRPPLKIKLLGKQIILQNAVDRSETIFPTYLFSFFISTSIIGYAYLIYSHHRHSGDFGCYFRLKAEAIFIKLNFLNNVGAK